MKSNIILTTGHNNNYFFNSKTRRFSLLHPILKYMLKLHNENIDIDNWYKSKKGSLIVHEYSTVSKEELYYYYRKFKFLKSNNQLDKFTFKDNVGLKILSDHIKSTIANCESISLEVTQKCNLNCKYCAYSENFNWFDKRDNKDLDYKKAIAFIDYFINKSETNLNNSYIKELKIVFYGGEPLINFSLISRVVRYVKKKKLIKTKIIFGMTTNAVLLKKHMDFLVQNNFSLLVSLDGNKEHNSYRVFHNGKPAFEVIKKNLMHLYNKYPDYFKKRIRFNSVLNNKSTVIDIVSFFKNTFDIVPAISEISPDGIKEEKKAEFLRMFSSYNEYFVNRRTCLPLEIEKNIDNPKDRKLREFVRHTGSSFMNYNSIEKEVTFMMTSTCMPFSFKTFLTTNGKILQCENVDHKYYIGEVEEDNVIINIDTIIKKYDEYFNKMKSQCFNCYFQTNCDQCIFYLNIESEKPICKSFTKDYNVYANFLSSQIQIIEDTPEKYVKIINN